MEKPKFNLKQEMVIQKIDDLELYKPKSFISKMQINKLKYKIWFEHPILKIFIYILHQNLTNQSVYYLGA